MGIHVLTRRRARGAPTLVIRDMTAERVIWCVGEDERRGGRTARACWAYCVRRLQKRERCSLVVPTTHNYSRWSRVWWCVRIKLPNWYRCLTSTGYRHGDEVAPGHYVGSGLGTPCTLAHTLRCLQVTARIRSRGLFSLAHYVYGTSDGKREC
jgi:hypothetical protein